MFSIYREGLRQLWQYHEFQVLYNGLRYGLLVLVVFLAFISLLHIGYMYGRNSPLYRRRSPRRGWSKHFFAVTIAMSVLLLVLFWGMGFLATQAR